VRRLFAALAAALGLAAQPLDPVDAALARQLLDPRQPAVEAQVYTAARVPLLPTFDSAAKWQAYAAALRKRILAEVVFRGEARAWRDARTRVETVSEEAGRGYRLRKLRYEVIPGLWLPALLYLPERLAGRVPVVLNVNGHETRGIATPYIQTRCIHLARNGIIAMNPEWFGRGQMSNATTGHYLINQMDLAGTSGLALFYLAMQRALDHLLALENADPARAAVTGLSGGGWQTIWISALDTRVKLAQPVAGYSSFVTRAQWPELDLGDSEQTPSDFAAIADYTHLTALMAPRAIQIAVSAKDTCCFRADYAVAPLIQAARPIFALVDAAANLRYHLNHGAGHNYDADNREAFYRFFGEHFFGGAGRFPLREDVAESEIRNDEQVRVALPDDNLDFPAIAKRLTDPLPRPTKASLASVVRYRAFDVDARVVAPGAWRLRMDGGAWTVPAVEIAPSAAPAGTTMVVADGGRKSVAAEVRAMLAEGQRVVALDPFYFGESKIDRRDWLFAILIASLGERPLGIQASQVAAAARWLTAVRGTGPVRVAAYGPRSSLFALIAAALEPKAIASARLHQSMKSLKEVVEQRLGANQTPELFCFGLLESFDIPQIAAMVRPRPVEMTH
jgi:dienelactone hydrolase